MKLTNTRILGRFVNPETGRSVNVHKGQDKQSGYDVHYFLRSGVRAYINERDFYENWVKATA